jgi:hypothetical protein
MQAVFYQATLDKRTSVSNNGRDGDRYEKQDGEKKGSFFPDTSRRLQRPSDWLIAHFCNSFRS